MHPMVLLQLQRLRARASAAQVVCVTAWSSPEVATALNEWAPGLRWIDLVAEAQATALPVAQVATTLTMRPWRWKRGITLRHASSRESPSASRTQRKDCMANDIRSFLFFLGGGDVRARRPFGCHVTVCASF